MCGGWSLPVSLTYNSENWRQDGGGTWNLGRDVGYGHGWKLLAGSLTPFYYGWYSVHHYLFTDSTGAEYRLDQNNGGALWWSKESIYVWYDANAGRLYFRDGSFWVFGCASGGTEEDSGTLYPTLMQDTNGNQITINYGSGAGLMWNNSSARILNIEDVRGNGFADYTFTYTNLNGNDPFVHLTGINNAIGTAEKYSFSYLNQGLASPFDASSFGVTSLLQQITATGPNLTTWLAYSQMGGSTTGELVQVATPYGGQINWSYIAYHYCPANEDGGVVKYCVC